MPIDPKDFKDYCDHIVSSYTSRTGDTIKVDVKIGRKFAKIVTTVSLTTSVHSFIVIDGTGKFKVGDILKPAGWNVPAQNFARGNIINRHYKDISWAGV